MPDDLSIGPDPAQFAEKIERASIGGECEIQAMPKCFDVELKSAIFAYTAGGQPTYAVVTKENHYGDVGSFVTTT